MDSKTLLLLGLLNFINTASGHQCYVCAPDSGKVEDVNQLKKFFPSVSIPPCSQYRPGLQQHYLLECPASASQGCLTKFEGTGSVMRTCAHISVEDCKTANGVNYCYCKESGCNTPDRRLSPAATGARVGKVADPDRKHLTSILAAHSAPAFSDDEDLEEGSADWGDFYYDEYNYGEYSYPGVSFDGSEGDDEDGYGGAQYEDVTDPPPFIDLEDGRYKNKYGIDDDKVVEEIINDIELVEEEERERGKHRGKGGRRHQTTGTAASSSSTFSLLVVCLLWVRL